MCGDELVGAMLEARGKPDVCCQFACVGVLLESEMRDDCGVGDVEERLRTSG